MSNPLASSPINEHRKSCDILFKKTGLELEALQNLFRQCVKEVRVLDEFRVTTLDFLMHNRSILDFTAHELIQFCIKRPRKIYFPIASADKPKKEFQSQIDKEYLPGLSKQRPDIFSYVDSIQGYHTGNEWLPAFAKLANNNKHIHLSKMEIAGFECVIIEVLGQPRVQVGDRGFRALDLSRAGSTARFPIPGGKYLDLRGPQIIDRHTRTLVDADPGIAVVPHVWQEFKFDEYPHHPAIMFLEIVDKSVREIVERLHKLVDTGLLAIEMPFPIDGSP